MELGTLACKEYAAKTFERPFLMELNVVLDA